MFDLPESPLPYADKYFIRSRRILEAERLNPTVTMSLSKRPCTGSR